MKLMRAHAFLAGGHQMIGENPFVQRNMRVFHYGADRHREGLVAFVAPMDTWPRALARKLRNASRIGISAMAAGDAIRPIQPLKMLAGFVRVGENRVWKGTPWLGLSLGG